jgi:hypothetical protein
VGVVDDGDQHLASAVDFEGFLDQEPLAVVIVALEVDLQRTVHRWLRWVAGNCYELFSYHSFGLFVVAGFFQNSRADMVFCYRIAMN